MQELSVLMDWTRTHTRKHERAFSHCRPESAFPSRHSLASKEEEKEDSRETAKSKKKNKKNENFGFEDLGIFTSPTITSTHLPTRLKTARTRARRQHT